MKLHIKPNHLEESIRIWQIYGCGQVGMDSSTFNVDKCSYLLIGSESNTQKFFLNNFNRTHINNDVIPQVEYARNLGVMFDSK